MRGQVAIVMAVVAGCGFDVTGQGSAGDGASTTGGTEGTAASTLPSDGTASGSESSASASAGTGTVTGTTTTSTTGATSTSGGTSGATEAGATTDASGSSTGEQEACTLLIAEFLAGIASADDEREWAKLYNPCPEEIDLSTISLGWGGDTFRGVVDLVGTVASGECFVIGGPISDSLNYDPVYDQLYDYELSLITTDGAMLLYDAPASGVDISTVPFDAIIYGSSNGAGFLDPAGAVGAVVIGGPGDDATLRRTGPQSWELGSPPTPNVCPTF